MNERVVVGRPGGALKVLREPEPVPRAGQVKVRVLAAGVAFGDVLRRRGVGVRASAFPITPGFDFVGVVEEFGAESRRFAVGDRVAGLPVVGGYQRFICVPEKDLVLVPQDLPPEDVVSLVLNYTTAYQLLTRTARLAPGDAALFHGAAGGVGTAMLQLARLLGIRMYGTASAGKADLVRELGGVPIDYKRTDFVEELRALEPDGVQAVFDPIGGPQLSRSYRAVAKGGTLVLAGTASAVQGNGNPTLALAATVARFLLLKLRPDSRRVVAYTIESAKNRSPEHFREDLQKLLALLRDGEISPRISEFMPLSDAGRAHELLEAAKVTGKIVLRP